MVAETSWTASRPAWARAARRVEHSGEEDAGGEAEAGGSGDHDAGDLEGAVGGYEAPEAEGHVVLAADDGDGA